MRIRILGAGAVGGLLGALAAEAGHEVTFTGSAEAMRQLAARGLRVILPERWLCLPKVNTAVAPAARRPPELTIVALKRHQLKELGQTPAFPSSGLRLVLNGPGLPGDGESLQGFTLLTAVMLQPGEVELASRKSVLILPRHDALRALARDWKAGGIEVAETDSPEPVATSFFLWQLLFLPVALCHSTLAHFLAEEAGRRVALGVLEEGLAVCRRLGLKTARLPQHDPQELVQLLHRRPEEFVRGGQVPDRGFNALLQSLLRGRKTEVRELNEKLVRLAAEAGVDPHWNWRLVRRLSRVTQVGFFRSPAELVQALN